jgi:hypothetical protein
MANNSRINPMYVDTASDSRLVNDATELMISGVLCIPSDPTWAVILKDGAGNVKFSASNVAAGAVMPPCQPFKTTGLVVNTLTNATALIYTIPS